MTPPPRVPRGGGSAEAARRICFGGAGDEDDSDIEAAATALPAPPTRREDAGPGDEADLDEDVPMTQEEEEVNVGLRSLNCSQEQAPVEGSPGCRKVEEVVDLCDSPEAEVVDLSGNSPASAARDEKMPASAAHDEKTPASAARDERILAAAARNGKIPVTVDAAADKNADEGDGDGDAMDVCDDAGEPSESSPPRSEDYETAPDISPAADAADAVVSSPVLTGAHSSASSSSSDSLSVAALAARDMSECESDLDSSGDEVLMAPVVRRRGRSAGAPDRYNPSEPSRPARVGSVFGALGSDSVRAARRPVVAVAKLRRAHEKDLESARELEELRREVELAEEGMGDGELDAEEEAFAELAAAQDKDKVKSQKIWDRFERPTSLFVRPVEMLARDEEDFNLPDESEKKYSRKTFRQKSFEHPLTMMLADGVRVPGLDVGAVLTMSSMRWTIDPGSGVDCGHEASDKLVRMLWQLVAHDETPVSPKPGPGFEGSGDRDDIFLVLLEVCERAGSSSRALQPLRPLLVRYGADFDGAMSPCEAALAASETLAIMTEEASSATEDDVLHRTAGMDRSSLDYAITAIPDVEYDPASIASRAARNLRRAFRVYEVAVRAGMDLKWLCLSESEVGVGLKNSRKRYDFGAWTTDDADAAVQILVTCGRVLVSPFGPEISREVGRAMAAVFERVPTHLWPDFRWRAAKALLNVSTRMGILVDLATYHLPYLTPRGRGLRLDFAFLGVSQWCAGPGADPKAVDVSQQPPPVPGSEIMSYSLGDVSSKLSMIQGVQKGTNSVWLLRLGELAKQALCDTDVLMARKPNDMKRLLGLVSGLPKLSRRVGQDLPISNFRLAVTTISNVLRGHSEIDREAKRELNPESCARKSQQTMHDLFKKPA